MFIIIEGVDDTGKTTLAQELIGDPNDYRHSGPPAYNALVEYTDKIREAAPLLKDLVWDRLHWGEVVYGPHYRGESQLDDAQRYWLDLYAASRGGVMILCVDSPSDIYDRVRDNQDDFVDHDLNHLRELQARFMALSEDTPLSVLIHSISKPLDSSAVLSHADGAAEFTEPMRRSSHWHCVGVYEPTVLLVGDQVGNKHLDDPSALPFMPALATSGHFLMRAIRQTSLRHQVMITNTRLPNDKMVPVDRIMDEVPSLEAVVALGRKSSERLTDMGVEHGVAFHPQYVKRFFHSQLSEYGASLLGAAAGLDTTQGGWVGR